MSADLSKLRVLIVDDCEDAAEALAALLALEGATVRVGLSARNIVDMVQTFKPSLILLDLGMVHVNGFEACQRIRDAFGPDLFIAALTGWDTLEDRAMCKKVGFDVHLVKPVRFAEIKELARIAVMDVDAAKHSS